MSTPVRKTQGLEAWARAAARPAKGPGKLGTSATKRPRVFALGGTCSSVLPTNRTSETTGAAVPAIWAAKLLPCQGRKALGEPNRLLFPPSRMATVMGNLPFKHNSEFFAADRRLWTVDCL